MTIPAATSRLSNVPAPLAAPRPTEPSAGEPAAGAPAPATSWTAKDVKSDKAARIEAFKQAIAVDDGLGALSKTLAARAAKGEQGTTPKLRLWNDAFSRQHAAAAKITEQLPAYAKHLEVGSFAQTDVQKLTKDEQLDLVVKFASADDEGLLADLREQFAQGATPEHAAKAVDAALADMRVDASPTERQDLIDALAASNQRMLGLVDSIVKNKGALGEGELMYELIKSSAHNSETWTKLSGKE